MSPISIHFSEAINNLTIDILALTIHISHVTNSNSQFILTIHISTLTIHMSLKSILISI